MSIHDMVTYRDPATPGMAFGRPPTRPGYRRDITSAAVPSRAVAPSTVRASADTSSPDGTSAGGASAGGASAVAASADRTVADPGSDPVVTSAGARPVDPPDNGDPLAGPETETDVDRSESEALVDRSESEAEVDRSESEIEVDRPESQIEADRPTAEMDAGPDVVEPSMASNAAEAVDGSERSTPVLDGREPSLDADRVADLRRRWGAVQAGFVDDPRRAVEVADDIVAEAVSALQAAIDDRRRAVASPWRDDAGASTDTLLAAFHAYRAVFDRVLSA